MPEYMSMLCTSNILTKHSLKEKRLAFHSTGNGVNGLGKSLAGTHSEDTEDIQMTQTTHRQCNKSKPTSLMPHGDECIPMEQTKAEEADVQISVYLLPVRN